MHNERNGSRVGYTVNNYIDKALTGHFNSY